MIFICSKIFLARILDVSLGTVRMILLVKGRKLSASIISFVEISIWFLIVREALTLVGDNPFIVIAYAGGFTAGTYIGSILSDKYISGTLNVQVISNKSEQLITAIRDNDFAVSVVDVKGFDQTIQRAMLFIEIDKKDLNCLKKIVNQIDEKAFIIINETKYVQNGYFQKRG